MGFENTISDEELANLQALSARVENRVQYATIEVPSTEILALFATPKELVAAPGVGKVLEFLSAVLVLDFNSAAYATNGILSVRETNAAGTAHSATALLAAFLAQTADTILPVQPLATGLALAENTPMVLSAAAAETATGDSPMTVKVAYRVHNTGL